MPVTITGNIFLSSLVFFFYILCKWQHGKFIVLKLSLAFRRVFVRASVLVAWTGMFLIFSGCIILHCILHKLIHSSTDEYDLVLRFYKFLREFLWLCNSCYSIAVDGYNFSRLEFQGSVSYYIVLCCSYICVYVISLNSILWEKARSSNFSWTYWSFTWLPWKHDYLTHLIIL